MILTVSKFLLFFKFIGLFDWKHCLDWLIFGCFYIVLHQSEELLQIQYISFFFLIILCAQNPWHLGASMAGLFTSNHLPFTAPLWVWILPWTLKSFINARRGALGFPLPVKAEKGCHMTFTLSIRLKIQNMTFFKIFFLSKVGSSTRHFNVNLIHVSL